MFHCLYFAFKYVKSEVSELNFHAKIRNMLGSLRSLKAIY